MKTMTFLVNPRGKKARASGRGKQRHTKRPPPEGWASWGEYMASIRPNSHKHKARASTSSGSSSMAAKKGHRKHHARKGPAASRINPPRRRRHTRHNPMGHKSIAGKLKNLPHFAIHTVTGAGIAIGGKIAARKLRGLANQQAGTVLGSLIEAGVGLVGGLLIGHVSPNAGAMFALGGVMAPMETGLQQLKIPHISDSLGDDGYYVGGDSGVTLVSANPDDYKTAALGRYVAPVRRPTLVVAADPAKFDSKHAAA